jgi:hypothetical protein
MLCVFAQEGDYRYNMMQHLHILTEKVWNVWLKITK